MSMSNKKIIRKERDLQEFIARNPWLLNMNYETVPELTKDGVEFQAGDQKRIDLILRDKINKTPVVVEFKFGSFTRENIGQILEYKARVAMTFNKDDAVLFHEFNDFVLTPSLVLVVKNCDDFSRIACNLSGIQVFEYKNFSQNFTAPEKRQAIEDFTEALKKGNYPLSMNRLDQIENEIYEPIKEVLKKHNLDKLWREPKRSVDGYFYPEYKDIFVNRLIFEDKDIQIGLIEDFIDADDADADSIQIVFYSGKEDEFRKFGKLYNTESTQKIKFNWVPEYGEGYGRKKFNRIDFFKRASKIFEDELKLYISIEKQMEKSK